jgi:hypothetical protein
MRKKCLDPADLRRLAEDRLRQPRNQPLSDAIVACAVMELLGPAYAYVRHARLGDVVEGVETPHAGVVSSLCVFAQDSSTWVPTVVVDCMPPGTCGDAGQILQSLGVTHVIVTPQQVAAGYIRMPQFRDAITRAVCRHASTRPDTEEFQSERKPIYPPRRGVAGD